MCNEKKPSFPKPKLDPNPPSEISIKINEGLEECGRPSPMKWTPVDDTTDPNAPQGGSGVNDKEKK